MTAPTATAAPPIPAAGIPGAAATRKDKRKALKKLKRKQIRQEAAIKEREEEEVRSNDPEEQLRLKLQEQEEAAAVERERRVFEERERILIEAAAAKRAGEEAAAEAREAEEETKGEEINVSAKLDEGDEWEYVEEGPAEIIWQGNEIIVKKKMVRAGKKSVNQNQYNEDYERPISNPLPPQSAAFISYKTGQSVSAQDTLESVAEQVPNFGTEQDKAHCPFHLKTGACRFGTRCSRAHFYPDKSCTLLIKNMYSGPGLAWEQDEGLEYTDEEVEHCYEEFYEDVHTEFLKFGELVNFKVCKNGAYHLRGNVYVHYKSMESAILAYNTINGRFFAGKQIFCEFVGVSRWKVAICGEYMKSRLRTCSHGTACNFIHCFRNPGGDYEWADWDNPPPKYWMKKMAFLFGPDEAGYEEQMKLEERERPWDSNRKSTPTNYRHYSRRSIHSERVMHNTGSRRKDGDEKRDSQSPRREHSSRRREGTYYPHKHEQSEENHRSQIHGYNVKHWARSIDGDSYKEHDGYFIKKHPKREEINVREDHEMAMKLKREEAFHKQEKQKKKHSSKSYKKPDKEYRSSDWISDKIDDNEERRSNSSSADTYGEHNIDVKERYDGRYVSAECGSDKYSLEKASMSHDERTELDQHSSRNCKSHASRDNEWSSENDRVRKQDSGDLKISSVGCRDGRKTTERNSGREEAHPSSRSHRKHDRSDRKHDRSDRKSNSSSADSYGEHNIDVKERYDERYCSADSGSDKYSLEKASTSHDERTELDQHCSRNRRRHASHDNEWSSENGRVRKQDSGDLKISSDGCRDGRKTTERNSGREEVHPSSRSHRKHDRSDRKCDRSDRKSKHRRKNEEYYETREQSGDSDSDNMESNRSAYKKLSRSGAPIHSSASSRRKRSRGSSKES